MGGILQNHDYGFNHYCPVKVANTRSKSMFLNENNRFKGVVVQGAKALVNKQGFNAYIVAGKIR